MPDTMTPKDRETNGVVFKECWCDKCEDFVIPKLKEWESSIAVIRDFICPKCGDVLIRIPSEVRKKAPITKEQAIYNISVYLQTNGRVIPPAFISSLKLCLELLTREGVK